MEDVKLDINELQTGLYIRLPAKWHEHPFLLNSFKLKSQEQIEMIRHLGISHVFINPNKSDFDPHFSPPKADIAVQLSEPDKDKLDQRAQVMWEEKKQRIEKVKSYRRKALQCEKDFERSLSRTRAIMNKIRSQPQNAASEASVLVEDIVEKLLSEKEVTLHFINSSSDLEDIYFHSLNVAVLSMMVGKAKGYSAEKIKLLAFGSLFHDIGKVKVPSKIVRSTHALTEPEKNYLKQHTRYGTEIADTIENFPESAKKIIAQHHEMADGSGYPEGLKGDEINELAQIVALTNAFDVMCHAHTPKDKKIPYSALSHLYKQRELYNEENLNLLIKYMGVYPPGSIVQLSNDLIGLVVSVHSNQLLYPSVLMYDPSVPRSQAPIIDLSEKESLSIVTVLSPGKVPEKVLEYLNPRSRISYFFDKEE
ncbi:Cyclic di-GMP phosphodiesterase response regulator RpfG [Vibrio aerogenes CECT 7868]|uniref:Cyclic di-GMP phosphodiesterase response regulator RpfG n=1 Tax=Vibrio aerogenes CECT 7868 TaxID=1216006 RepID=A0A1M6ALX9_9VIBR|nr:HD-GYP domain-containing protein [Vibrio aerogenes]SHI37509.1 Cyclic di-GMP phosphodiesterase response regulator RpfG [Vibrio aerogenes CECT 7868]